MTLIFYSSEDIESLDVYENLESLARFSCSETNKNRVILNKEETASIINSPCFIEMPAEDFLHHTCFYNRQKPKKFFMRRRDIILIQYSYPEISHRGFTITTRGGSYYTYSFTSKKIAQQEIGRLTASLNGEI